MKIIQSFALFKEGSPYMKNKNVHLNFYSFLLSYLTLNKYYGHVTMICNESAYDKFIKYIPYDEIISLENKNEFKYWNVYKLDAIRLINEDLVHVDSDVFIFDDLFRPFIDGNYDIMVQDLVPNFGEITNKFVKSNNKILIDAEILNVDEYDGYFTSCGTLGLKMNVRGKYFYAIDRIYKEMKENRIIDLNEQYEGMILEELLLYLVAHTNNFKIFDILTQNIVDSKKYTHMWFDNRFKERNIDLMRRKIRSDFPHYRSVIDKFETENLYN